MGWERAGLDGCGLRDEERTLDWLNRYRRLTIRYERRADMHDAFLTLTCALICFKALP